MLSRSSRRIFNATSRVRCLSSSTGATPNITTSSNDSSMKDMKTALAQAALKQVPQHGWTQDAITAAVLEDPQMSVSMSGLLTPSELVQWLMDDFNVQLREDPIKSQWTIFQKIQWRFEQVIPFVESGKWHEGMAMGLSNPFTTREQLHEFIEIVAPVGSSTVYKTGLGGVFIATELHLLADSSPDYTETWSFLQNRLDELENGEFVNVLMGVAFLWQQAQRLQHLSLRDFPVLYYRRPQLVPKGQSQATTYRNKS